MVVEDETAGFSEGEPQVEEATVVFDIRVGAVAIVDIEPDAGRDAQAHAAGRDTSTAVSAGLWK
jgi:hypothetical protein